MSAALSLMLEKNYVIYNGTPDELVIPVLKIPSKNEHGKKRKGSSKWILKPINYIDIPISKMWKQHSNRFTWNTLKNIRASFSCSHTRRWENFNDEENSQYCIEQIISFYDLNIHQ